MQSLKIDLNFILINVYGPISHLGKKVVWDELSFVFPKHKNSPILVGGDFNTILNLDEKVGSSQHLSHSSLDFKSWIGKHNMIDVPMNNGIYTWNNRRKDFAYIAKKLDRFFIIGNFGDYNLNFQSSILPIPGSDHYLVCFELSEPSKPVRNPFKCEKMWFQDPNFIENIRDWWKQARFEGSKMFVFVSKLKWLKEKILRWNRENFNNIFKEKMEIEDKLKNLNLEIIKHGMNNKTYVLEKELLAKP